MSEPPDTDTETFEHIPWSHLMDAHREGRTRTAVTVAGIVVAIAAGFVVASVVASDRSPRTIAEFPAAAATTTIPTAVELEPAVGPPTTLRSLLSEADLMATVPDDAAAVSAVAEWFVTDYFTADGGGSASFMQWARAFDVTATPAGYDVTVVFAALGAGADGVYVRQPVRAVRISLARDGSGWSVSRLPHPAWIPLPRAPDAPADLGPVPEGVAAAATGLAGDWAVASVVGGTEDIHGWTVVVEVADEAGNLWPLEVVVPG